MRCLLRKLFVYAVGRDVRPRDEVVLAKVVESLPERPTLEDLVVVIVGLDAFFKRRPL